MRWDRARDGDMTYLDAALLRLLRCQVIKAPHDESYWEARLKKVRQELDRLTVADAYHHTLRESERYELCRRRVRWWRRRHRHCLLRCCDVCAGVPWTSD